MSSAGKNRINSLSWSPFPLSQNKQKPPLKAARNNRRENFRHSEFCYKKRSVVTIDLRLEAAIWISSWDA